MFHSCLFLEMILYVSLKKTQITHKAPKEELPQLDKEHLRKTFSQHYIRCYEPDRFSFRLGGGEGNGNATAIHQCAESLC